MAMRRNADEEIRVLERIPFGEMSDLDMEKLKRWYQRLGDSAKLDRIEFEIEERDPNRILPVVFRTWDSTYRSGWHHEPSEPFMDDTVDALFLTEPGDLGGYKMNITVLAPRGNGYVVDHHADADYNAVMRRTRPATPSELSKAARVVAADQAFHKQPGIRAYARNRYEFDMKRRQKARYYYD